jgi:hypothetical protein
MTRRGDLAAALTGLENLLAASETFQAATGAADAEEAAAFIYWPGMKPYTETEGEGEQSVRTWPACFAVVRIGAGAGYAVPECVASVPVSVYLQLRTPENLRDDPKGEAVAFLEFVGKVMQDLAENSYGTGNLATRRISIRDVQKNDETETEDYMDCELDIEPGVGA